MNEPLTIVNTFLALSQSFDTDAAAYEAVLHPEVEQIEYPSALTKTTQHRTFSEIVDSVRIGRELLQDLHLDVQHTRLGSDGTVTVEGEWQATATNDFGPLVRGQRFSSQLCLVFEFKDGKIFRQRRYLCCEPL